MAVGGQGAPGLSRLFERPPESREDLECAAGAGSDGVWCEEQMAVEGRGDDAGVGHRSGDPLVEGGRGAIAAVPVNGDGAARAGDLRNDLLRRAAAQHEDLPRGPQTRCEAFQRLVQPPACHTAELTDLRALIIVHVEQHDRRIAPASGGQGRIV